MSCSERRSLRYAIKFTNSEPSPLKPLSTSGKKGVPRVERELSALRGAGPFRPVSAQDVHFPSGSDRIGTGLLSLFRVRPGDVFLGPVTPSIGAAFDAGGAGSRVVVGDPQHFHG